MTMITTVAIIPNTSNTAISATIWASTFASLIFGGASVYPPLLLSSNSSENLYPLVLPLREKALAKAPVFLGLFYLDMCCGPSQKCSFKKMGRYLSRVGHVASLLSPTYGRLSFWYEESLALLKRGAQITEDQFKVGCRKDE